MNYEMKRKALKLKTLWIWHDLWAAVEDEIWSFWIRYTFNDALKWNTDFSIPASRSYHIHDWWFKVIALIHSIISKSRIDDVLVASLVLEILMTIRAIKKLDHSMRVLNEIVLSRWLHAFKVCLLFSSCYEINVEVRVNDNWMFSNLFLTIVIVSAIIELLFFTACWRL